MSKASQPIIIIFSAGYVYFLKEYISIEGERASHIYRTGYILAGTISPHEWKRNGF
jgi:hypothetical protein